MLGDLARDDVLPGSLSAGSRVSGEGYGAECAKWSVVYVCVCIYLIAFLTSLCFGVCCSGLRGGGWRNTCAGSVEMTRRWWRLVSCCCCHYYCPHLVLLFAGTTHVGEGMAVSDAGCVVLQIRQAEIVCDVARSSSPSSAHEANQTHGSPICVNVALHVHVR